MSPAACPTCRKTTSIKVSPEHVGYSVLCDDCYDVDCVGDPPRYVACTPIGWGDTREKAIAEWNDRVELVEDES